MTMEEYYTFEEREKIINEILYNKIINNTNIIEYPYQLETRTYIYCGRVLIERYVYIGEDNAMFSITDKEYEYLLEKMKEKVKENEV